MCPLCPSSGTPAQYGGGACVPCSGTTAQYGGGGAYVPYVLVVVLQHSMEEEEHVSPKSL